jgi:hypothetical protein
VRAEVIAAGWEALVSKSNVGKTPIGSKEGDGVLGKGEEKDFWVSKMKNEKARLQAEMIRNAGKGREREQIRRKE